MKIPNMIDPSVASKIKHRLHRKYDRINSKEPTNSDSGKAIGFLQGFKGDIGWILSTRPTHDSIPSTPYIEDSNIGGIVVRPGVDLGHNDRLVFEKVLLPNLKRNQRRILSDAIGLRGQNAVDFLNDNLSSIGTLDPLDEDRHKKALSIAMNVYWKRLIEDNPWLLDSRINADYHTILMSYALDFGTDKYGKFYNLLTYADADQRCLFSRWLNEQSKIQSMALVQRERRSKESAFLLRNILPLSQSIGPNCANQPEDVLLITERLRELGFMPNNNSLSYEYTFNLVERKDSNGKLLGWELTIANNANLSSVKQIFDLNTAVKSEIIPMAEELMESNDQTFNGVVYPKSGTEHPQSVSNQVPLVSDFSPLVNFQNVVNGVSNSDGKVFPGDLTHLWLCSEMAPKISAIPTQIMGVEDISSVLSITTSTTNWIYSVIEHSGSRFQKIQTADEQNEGTVQKSAFRIPEIGINDLYFKISIPSTSSSNSCSTLDPHYDRESMRVILQAVISDIGVLNANSIHLYDPVLASERLCTLQPHDTNQTQASTNFAYVRIQRPEFFKLNHLQKSESSLQSSPVAEVPEITSSIEPLSPNMVQMISSIFETISERNMHLDDEIKRGQYYHQMLIAGHENEYTKKDGSVVSPAILDPLPTNTPYLLGIRNWRKNQHILPTHNNYNDTLLLIWNDGNQIQTRDYCVTTVPRQSRAYRNLKGDMHLKSGRYLFELRMESSESYLQQHGDVEVGWDADKQGHLSQNSVSESGNFGLKIAAGESSVLTRKANGSQLFKVGSQVGLNDFDDFWHLLTSEFGLVEGDTVLYTLLDGNDAISSVDIDQLFASQNPGPNNQPIAINYVISGQDIFDQSGNKIGVDVTVENNVDWPRIVKHFDDSITISVAEGNVSSKLTGTGPSVTGIFAHRHYYPPEGTLVHPGGDF